MKALALLLIAAALLVPNVALAQDDVVIVTAQRSDRGDFNEYYDDDQSAIGLTRQADFFVKPLYVSSDSRDPAVRREELLTMLRATIDRARAQGVALVAGDYTLEPVTLSSIDDLDITSGRRPDTSRVQIYARLPVGGSVKSVDLADKRIQEFVKSVPATGRSYIETGSTGLAISNPDQYRLAVVRTIAAEAKSYAAQFGGDYGIEIRGLDSELFWQQASETEVFLYIEHNFVIAPK